MFAHIDLKISILTKLKNGEIVRNFNLEISYFITRMFAHIDFLFFRKTLNRRNRNTGFLKILKLYKKRKKRKTI